MISEKAIDYCYGDLTKIQNYDLAVLDKTCVWWIFHKNLITGVGRMSKYTLKSLGMFYGAKAEDLIFVKKEDLRMIEEHFPKTEKDGRTMFLVFKFWSRLNPKTPFSFITEREFDEINRSVRRLRIIWD